jgi:uncharacterized protein with HEPN domain
MLASNLELIRHIFDETDFVLRHSLNKEKEILFSDEVMCRAIVRSLEIIGVASRKLDDEFKSFYPHVEWKKMAGTRDKLIHDYFGIDYDIVWDIIVNKLPDLHHFIEEIILQLEAK